MQTKSLIFFAVRTTKAACFNLCRIFAVQQLVLTAKVSVGFLLLSAMVLLMFGLVWALFITSYSKGRLSKATFEGLGGFCKTFGVFLRACKCENGFIAVSAE